MKLLQLRENDYKFKLLETNKIKQLILVVEMIKILFYKFLVKVEPSYAFESAPDSALTWMVGNIGGEYDKTLGRCI